MDADGYIYIMGRVDDVINVAGHRLSTGGMEEVVAKHQDVAECAVIGVNDVLKGQVPIGFIVLKAGVSKPNNEITKEVVTMVTGRDRRLGLPEGCGRGSSPSQDTKRQDP